MDNSKRGKKMIILVQSVKEVQQGQYTNLEVKGLNTKTNKETTQTLYSTLKDKWPLCQVNKLTELVMKNQGTKDAPKWQVVDVKLPPEPIAPPTTETPPPGVEPKSTPAPRPLDIPGQQVGMVTKMIGDLIIAGLLYKTFGEEAGTNLLRWFQGQILGTTKVNFDSQKLPPIKENK